MKKRLIDFFHKVASGGRKQSNPGNLPALASTASPVSEDFMADISAGFQSALHSLGDQGYFLNLRIDPPYVDSVSNGKAFLKCVGHIRAADDQHLAYITISERDRTVFCSYKNVIQNSLWGESLGIRYKVKNPADPKEWYDPKSKGNLYSDLLKAIQFMEITPDPHKSTRFRGVEMKPIIK